MAKKSASSPARPLGNGIVYLIHFDRKHKHAGHYIGWSRSAWALTKRLEHHRQGTGAKFMRVITKEGIEFTVTRTWRGSKLLERVLKERKASPTLCPVCCSAKGRKPSPAKYTRLTLMEAYARFMDKVAYRVIEQRVAELAARVGKQNRELKRLRNELNLLKTGGLHSVTHNTKPLNNGGSIH